MIHLTRLSVFTVAAFGFAYIIGYSGVTLGLRKWIEPVTSPYATTSPTGQVSVDVRISRWDEIRNWILELMECPACLGFHIGFWVGFALPQYLGMDSRPVAAMTLALFTTGSNFLLGRLTGLIRP